MSNGNHGVSPLLHAETPQVGESVFGHDNPSQVAWRRDNGMGRHVTNDTALENTVDHGGRLEADQRRVLQRQTRPFDEVHMTADTRVLTSPDGVGNDLAL